MSEKKNLEKSDKKNMYVYVIKYTIVMKTSQVPPFPSLK